MSTPNTSLQERMAETRAVSEASMICRSLSDSIMEASTKRFLKSRGARIERWVQLIACAQAQINGLSALAKQAPRRTAKPRAVPPAASTPSGEPATQVA